MTRHRALNTLIVLTVFLAFAAGSLPADVARAKQGTGSGRLAVLKGASVGPQLVSAARTVDMVRVSGRDRIATAAAAAEAAFPDGASTAILARADSFPDALTAAALAGIRSAPVLLTSTNRLAPGTASALHRLGVDEVVLVGGQAALSAALEQSLRERYDVARVGGRDRYETAARIARAARDGGGGGQATALLASGESYPDALAAGSLAFHEKLPMLLSGARSLHGATRAALRDLDIDRVVVIGGPSALGQSVVADLERAGVKVTRIGGVTRLESARLLADYALEHWGLSPRIPVLVRGDDFPDALVAGSYAGRLGSPILLAAAPHTLGSPAAGWLAQRCMRVDGVHVLGGQVAVSDRVLQSARAAARECGNADGEPGGGSLREGVGGESRPRGDEYAIPAGYPHGGNTGIVGAGFDDGDLRLHEGDLTVENDGEVIEDLDVRGRLIIQADDVTVRRVRVLASTSLYALDWRGGSSWDGVRGLVVEDTEIYNQSAEGRAVGGAGEGTFRRINAYGGATVFYASSGARIEDSFIHDPLPIAGGHHDGVQSSGGTGPVVIRSTVLGRYRAQTSALILQSNFSAKSGVVLQDNFLAGGNYTVYISAKDGMPHPSDVTVTGNLWQAGSWQYGPTRTKVGDRWTWSGNRTTQDDPVEF